MLKQPNNLVASIPLLPALASTIKGHPGYKMRLLIPYLASDILVELTFSSPLVATALALFQQAQLERDIYASPPLFALPLETAAQLAYASMSTLLAWVRKGYLHCWKVGSVHYFSPCEIRALGLRVNDMRKWRPARPTGVHADAIAMGRDTALTLHQHEGHLFCPDRAPLCDKGFDDALL